MANFFKRLFKKKNNTLSDTIIKTNTGNVATDEAVSSVNQTKVKFSKPDKYDRSAIVDQSAMNRAKKQTFDNNKVVKDPYSGYILKENQASAKSVYGDENYDKHSPEPDHIVPLEKIYAQFKDDSFATVDDIKRIANSEENLVVTSRKFNNAKRSRTNSNFVNDEEYLYNKGVKLSEEGRQKALQDEIDSQNYISKEHRKNFVSRVSETFHQSGVKGAVSAGKMTIATSGIINIVSVINGEKKTDEAVSDVVEDSAKSAISGYLISGTSTTIAQAFSQSSNNLVRLLTDANVSGKIITSVITTYGTLEKYIKGEITTNQCILDLGEKGSILSTSAYSMAIGQAVIPVPIVGAAIGALFGASVTSGIYKSLTSCLQKNEIEYQERQQIIAECAILAEEEKRYRIELEKYLKEYFKEYRNCFSNALSTIDLAFSIGDADGVIAGANQITRKLGGNVHYNTVNEFKDFLASDEVDIF